MIFKGTPIDGAFVIEPERMEDARGFFARTWSASELEKGGLDPVLAECSISFNALKGTLRGMHYQTAPDEETKVVRCTMGAIYDVILDLRPSSQTYRTWTSVELTSENRLALYIPKGVAHGFQTLTDDSEVYYQISASYSAAHARGIRWNDPGVGIHWPMLPTTISPRDRKLPLLASVRNQ